MEFPFSYEGFFCTEKNISIGKDIVSNTLANYGVL